MPLPSNIRITTLSIRYVSNCRLAPELHANIEASLVSKRLAISLHPSQRNRFQLWKPIFGPGVCLAIIYDSHGFTQTILTQVSDNEMYSLEDLCNTRSGTLGPALRFQIGNIFLCHLFVYTLRVEYFLAPNIAPFLQTDHISRPGSCEKLWALPGTSSDVDLYFDKTMLNNVRKQKLIICSMFQIFFQARAFICEGCHSKQPVFPFQVSSKRNNLLSWWSCNCLILQRPLLH